MHTGIRNAKPRRIFYDSNLDVRSGWMSGWEVIAYGENRTQCPHDCYSQQNLYAPKRVSCHLQRDRIQINSNHVKCLTGNNWNTLNLTMENPLDLLYEGTGHLTPVRNCENNVNNTIVLRTKKNITKPFYAYRVCYSCIFRTRLICPSAWKRIHRRFRTTTDPPKTLSVRLLVVSRI